MKAIIDIFFAWATKLYIVVFARPSMQRLNRMVLQLALFGYGYNTHYGIEKNGEEAFIRRLATLDPQLCIDIGANVGEYTHALLKHTNARVIAFEPLPGAFAKIADLAASYPGRLTGINQALGAAEAVLDLHYAHDASALATLCSDVNKIDYIGAHMKHTMPIKVTTLDAFFAAHPEWDGQAIDLIKIDTEGFEYEVLCGAVQTIAGRRPKCIQLEYNTHQLVRGHSIMQLAERLPGYCLYHILPYGSTLMPRNPKAPENNIYHYANFVFVREDITHTL